MGTVSRRRFLESSAAMALAAGWAVRAGADPGARAGGLPLVPWPRAIAYGDGALSLPCDARIVVDAESAAPLGPILSGEAGALFGCAWAVAEGPGSNPGDVVLRMDPALETEAYQLEVRDRVTVTGGSYAGLAAGTVTLLQALQAGDDGLSLPVMTIQDAPHAAYRGLLVDPARHWHSPQMLRQCIALCRWYKIRYLQLHLTDNQSFTFPSQAYPQLATADRHYTLEDLRALDRYAADRGVVLVPEFEMPGHGGAAIRAMPEVFATTTGSPHTMNFASPDACAVLDTVIGEMADVFRTTPYFHIGADETNLTGLDTDPVFRAAMDRTGLPNADELYRAFIVERNETVKRLGKQLIIWEGFRPNGIVPIPRDILVMVFESSYHLPNLLVDGGYTIINTTWQPLYVVTRREPPVGQWPVEHIYGWNMYRWEHFREGYPAYEPIQLRFDTPVLGAQVCSWENPEEVVIPFVRDRLAAMSERIWNPMAGRGFREFSSRLAATNPRLDLLLANA